MLLIFAIMVLIACLIMRKTKTPEQIHKMAQENKAFVRDVAIGGAVYTAVKVIKDGDD